MRFNSAKGNSNATNNHANGPAAVGPLADAGNFERIADPVDGIQQETASRRPPHPHQRGIHISPSQRPGRSSGSPSINCSAISSTIIIELPTTKRSSSLVRASSAHRLNRRKSSKLNPCCRVKKTSSVDAANRVPSNSCSRNRTRSSSDRSSAMVIPFVCCGDSRKDIPFRNPVEREPAYTLFVLSRRGG